MAHVIRRALTISIFVATTFGTASLGQVIDFETVPDQTPVELLPIDTQYRTDYGVSFSLVDNGTCGTVCSGSPLLARVGGPRKAFQGPTGTSFPECGVVNNARQDMPASSAQSRTGCFFLTDDGNLGNDPCGLRVDYDWPVTVAEGALIDIDMNEEWTVTAYFEGTQVGNSLTLTPLMGGDGVLTEWSIVAPDGETIDRILVEYTGACNEGAGLAFDRFSPAGRPCAPPPEGMLAWWPHDDLGITAAEIQGGHEGVRFAGFGDVGKVRRAIHGDNHNLKVEVPDPPFDGMDFGPYESFTIDAWVRSTLNLWEFDILEKMPGPECPEQLQGYRFWMDDGKRPSLTLATGGTAYEYQAAGTLTDDDWHFLAVTVDRTTCNAASNPADCITFYIDDQPYPAQTVDALPMGSLANGCSLVMGSRSSLQWWIHAFPRLIGIDEVELFDRALTPLEIWRIQAAQEHGKCWCAPTPTGLLGWWPLDEDPALTSTAHDISGQERHGAIDGAERDLCMVKSAMRFDGVDDGIEIPAADAPNLEGRSWSLEAWVSTTNGGHQTILDRNDSYQLFLYGGDPALITRGTESAYMFQTYQSIDDGACHHVVATMEVAGAELTAAIYIDGVAVYGPTSGTIDDPPLAPNVPDPLGIGNGVYTLTDPFEGTIDEVAIYGRALDGDEVWEIFNAADGGKCRYTPGVISGGSSGGCRVEVARPGHQGPVELGPGCGAGWQPEGPRLPEAGVDRSAR